MSTTSGQRAAPRTLGVVELVLRLVALVALVAAPAFWLNGLTQHGAAVVVPVRYASPSDTGTLAGVDGTPTAVALDVPGDPAALVRGERVPALLTAANQDLSLRAWGATWPELALARGDDLLRGLATGVGALLLARVVRDTAAGRPFSCRTSARVAGLTGCVAVATLVAPLLPPLASARVLGRLGAGGAAGALQPSGGLDLASLLLVGLLVALLHAVRHGERLARSAGGAG